MKKNQIANCCDEKSNVFPDHTKELHRLNRISGQIEGVKRMISEREYCPKIITQIQAVRAALKSLEAVVLKRHLNSCVKDAVNSRNRKDAEAKMAELIELFERD